MAANFLTLFTSRWKFASRLANWARETENRVERLEIQNRRLLEHLELLEEQQERLWAKFKGSVGGRPPKVRTASQNGVTELDAIPHGDKAALRRHFGLVPGGRTQETKGDQA